MPDKRVKEYTCAHYKPPPTPNTHTGDSETKRIHLSLSPSLSLLSHVITVTIQYRDKTNGGMEKWEGVQYRLTPWDICTKKGGKGINIAGGKGGEVHVRTYDQKIEKGVSVSVSPPMSGFFFFFIQQLLYYNYYNYYYDYSDAHVFCVFEKVPKQLT